jgi:hypothetical protein
MHVRPVSLRRTLLGGLLLALCCAPWAPLTAQSNTTALNGVVTDATGATMAGVTVTITAAGTGATKTILTKSTGEFDFEQLNPGTYKIHVKGATGFSEQEQTVELLVATPLNLHFKLTVGSSEVVDVSTGIAALNTEDATLGKAFDSQQIQTLPYLANNVNYLLSLQPGVLALDPGATTGGQNTDTRTGIVNGARQDQTNLTLDGVDNNDPNNGYAFVGILRSTRESVEEFRVTTTNGNADAGRSSGGQVSVTTRSGSNALHGSAYYIYRGPATASNNWFNKQSELQSGKPNISAKVLQDTYGAALGLPLLKDKLFFFGAYEGFKQATDTVVTETVPSLINPVAGDTVAGQTYGGLITGNVVYPSCPTSNSACTGITPTPVVLTKANIASIDQGCTLCSTPGTNSAALAYFNNFPIANSTSVGDSYNTGGYVFPSPAPLHQITNVARLDYTINPRQTVFIRGTLQSDNTSNALQFPSTTAFPALPTTQVFENNKGLAAGHIWQVNSALTNNLRYGFTRQGTANRGSGAHPYISFSSFSNLTSTSSSSIYLVDTNNIVDDATFVKGKHTLQFGVNDRFISNSRYSTSTLYPSGSVSASLLATAAIAGTGSVLDPTNTFGGVQKSFKSSYNNDILANVGGITSAGSYTNFLISGNQLTPAPAGTVPTHDYHATEQEYYFQDQWKATSRLTLTAGVRYTHLGVPYEINGQQVAPNINLGTTFLQNRIAQAAAGSAYSTDIQVVPGGQANGAPNLWTPQKLNFAPRLAFAYASPDNKTSVRGGFAIAFDHFGEAVIDYYDANGAFALSRLNPFAYPTAAGVSPFTGYENVPIGTVNATAQTFPIDPAQTTIASFGSSFVRDIDANLKTPYAETFNFSVQREVIRGMTVTASYVGRLGRHVLDNLDVAQPTNLFDPTSGQTYFQAVDAYAKSIDAGVPVANIPNSGYFQDLFPKATYTVAKTSTSPAITYTGAQAYYASLIVDRATGNETNTLYNFDTTPAFAPANQQLRFFYPQYSSIYVQGSVGTSNYNALQLSVRHAFKFGNEYDINYTYSKSLDFGSSPERSNASSIINTFNPSQMYAVSDYDVRHNVTANYGLSLPFGKGQPFLVNTNRILDALVGGWKLNGTVHYSTGFPFSAVDSGNYGTNFDMSSYAVQIAPLATGGHRYVGGISAPYETAFKTATVAQAQAAFRFAYPGETGQRNELRADGYLSLDDGLSKSFKTFREQSFKLSAEVFNVLNNSRFNTQSSSSTVNVGSTKFGDYAGLLVSPRQMQFSGKYVF